MSEKMAAALPAGTRECGTCDGRGVIYQCVICGSGEPRTGTCSGPHDPRSLCAALAAQPAAQASAGSIRSDARFQDTSVAYAISIRNRASFAEMNAAFDAVVASIDSWADSRQRQGDHPGELAQEIATDLAAQAEELTGAVFALYATKPKGGQSYAWLEALSLLEQPPRAPSDTQGAGLPIMSWRDRRKGYEDIAGADMLFMMNEIDGLRAALAQQAPDAARDVARSIATGYEGGTLATDPTQLGATINLHYESPEEAENAFCALSNLIDSAIKSTAPKLAGNGEGE